MSSSAAPQSNDTSISGIFSAGGRANQSSGQTITNFLSSVVAGFAAFGIEFLVFLIIKHKLFRI